jgi:prepilin-type processing-associated H-X9-DG protein
VALAARLYMDDNNGSMFHHHEGWVLDDGTQTPTLPTDMSGVSGGGAGNSQAEKPWVIIFQPYLKGRGVAFCPADRTPRSRFLATEMADYNGGITTTGQTPPANSEQAIAQAEHLTIESYLLNSIYTHKSARYALEGVLNGFATDSAIAGMPNRNFIAFSERNSEALNAADNAQYGSVNQDDYDTWAGEAALVRWGSGSYGDQGWIRYNRHDKGANYVYADSHVEYLTWSKARGDQYPDRVVRLPLANPPQ